MPTWKDELAPEIRDNPIVAKYETPADLAKALIAVQPMIGAEKLVLPKDEKDEAGWTQVYTKLGRPEAATGYQVPTLEGLPEGFAIEEDRVKAFTEMAHKHGLSQRQAAGLYQDYMTDQAGRFKAIMDAQDGALAAAEKALRTEWGTGYEAQVSLAKKTLAAFAGDDQTAAALAGTYGNDPRFVRLMARLGNELSEDVLGAGSPKPGDLTPEAAQKQINEIMGNATHPYFVAEHPEHKAALELMERLMVQLHGSETVAT